MPIRKKLRYKNYDYSQHGAYHIIIHTKDNRYLLCEIITEPGTVYHMLTELGLTVVNEIEIMSNTYENIKVINYAVMPNHVHILIRNDTEPSQLAPTISRMIKQFKGSITKKVGISIWQRSFYDRIIRDEAEFYRVCGYIQDNLKNWDIDVFYM